MLLDAVDGQHDDPKNFSVASELGEEQEDLESEFDDNDASSETGQPGIEQKEPEMPEPWATNPHASLPASHMKPLDRPKRGIQSEVWKSIRKVMQLHPAMRSNTAQATTITNVRQSNRADATHVCIHPVPDGFCNTLIKIQGTKKSGSTAFTLSTTKVINHFKRCHPSSNVVATSAKAADARSDKRAVDMHTYSLQEANNSTQEAKRYKQTKISDTSILGSKEKVQMAICKW